MKEKDSPSIESLLATTRIRPVVANAVDTWRRMHGNPSRASYFRKAIEQELIRDGILETDAA